jgi:hypothetical protein
MLTIICGPAQVEKGMRNSRIGYDVCACVLSCVSLELSSKIDATYRSLYFMSEGHSLSRYSYFSFICPVGVTRLSRQKATAAGKC